MTLPIKAEYEMIIEHINNSNMSPYVKKVCVSAIMFAEGESMLKVNS